MLQIKINIFIYVLLNSTQMFKETTKYVFFVNISPINANTFYSIIFFLLLLGIVTVLTYCCPFVGLIASIVLICKSLWIKVWLNVNVFIVYFVSLNIQ